MSEISNNRRRRIKCVFYSILISTSKKSRKSCTLSKNNITINIFNVKTLFLLFYQNYQDKNSCIKNEQNFDKLTVMSTAKVTE